MATAMNEELRALRRSTARFAEEAVAPRRDLVEQTTFPPDLWLRMAEEGLLGLSLPEPYGGSGRGYLALAVAGEALVARGRSMGLALGWLMHHAVAGFLVLGFGTEAQRGALLPDMARGRITGSFAVSEPGTGAHPKHLRTTGRPSGDGFVLDGEKAYLTNGPVADVYVVIAGTGETGGRKDLSAFLVPWGTPGLTRTAPMDIRMFRPTPHGGIRLEGCPVPRNALLGPPGRAYEAMVKPFRVVEDVLMMGPVAGGLARALEITTDGFKEHSRSSDPKLHAALGDLQSTLDAMRVLAYEAAAMLDTGEEHPESVSLPLAFRRLAKDFQDRRRRLLDAEGIRTGSGFESLENDLDAASNLAGHVARTKLRKLGERLVHKGETHDIDP